MDKYNKGLMLGGGIGNAYTQTTIADSALAMAESGEGGAGMMGLAMGLGAIGGTVSGLNQPTSRPRSPAQSDPVAVLGQLKAMLDQGLITAGAVRREAARGPRPHVGRSRRERPRGSSRETADRRRRGFARISLPRCSGDQAPKELAPAIRRATQSE